VSRRWIVVVAALAAFLAVALLLARWLTTETRERDAVYALLRAQARGDARAMLERLDDTCARRARCRAEVAANARGRRRAGEVKILAYRSETAYALGEATGPTRVAWAVIDRGLPVVQCVDVRRKGSVLAGRTVTLLRLSGPIGRESSC
jgi:hypothetical protein